MVTYAYRLWGLDFVKVLECENGRRDIHAVGDHWHAHGLCQLNDNRHKDVIGDPKPFSCKTRLTPGTEWYNKECDRQYKERLPKHEKRVEFDNSREVQLKECYKKWSTGTKFYWPSRVSKSTNGMKCSDYVNSRFTVLE